MSSKIPTKTSAHSKKTTEEDPQDREKKFEPQSVSTSKSNLVEVTKEGRTTPSVSSERDKEKGKLKSSKSPSPKTATQASKCSTPTSMKRSIAATPILSPAATPRTPSNQTDEIDPEVMTLYSSNSLGAWRSPKKVRRFSDLTSRADLENRLQFLEKKLYKKIRHHRFTSDSEVSSRKDSFSNISQNDELPSALPKDDNVENIEKRVQALEKQLSENSLRLLAAMRSDQTEGVDETEPVSRRLSTETIDVTGKELVRYAQIGQLEERSPKKPINISINIKMMLNKDESLKRTDPEAQTTAPGQEETKKESLLTIEELDRRLLLLEEHLNLSEADKEHVLKEEDQREVTINQGEELTLESSPTQMEDTQQNLNNEITEITSASMEMEGANPTDESEADKSAEVETKEEQLNNTEIARNEAETQENSKEKTPDKESVRVEDASAKEEPDHKNVIATKSVTDVHSQNITEVEKDCSPNRVLDACPQHEPDKATTEVKALTTKERTLVLLLDNEPKAVKVRRLTRANTEELENLFLTLEKQLSDRNLIKTEDGKLKHAGTDAVESKDQPTLEAQEITKLSKQIVAFTQEGNDPGSQPVAPAESKPQPVEETYDWGPDPVKRHLKRKTVYLPSTKELEARFRSLERQIKFLEDVEKIDVEQRLNEIERKIKLQYSLSHEKDLSKFLDLCEGKGLDDLPDAIPLQETHTCTCVKQRSSPNQTKSKSTTNSTQKSPYTSPSRTKECPPPTHISPSRRSQRSPYISPAHSNYEESDSGIPSTEDLEYRFRALDLKRSKSKENLSNKMKAIKQPIHPLEMILDPSPTDADIPTTGELEHRMRVLEESRTTPSPPRKSRSHSPRLTKGQFISSPEKRSPPTTEELEARMRALEAEHTFDSKAHKNFREFNQKLRNVVSPSYSSEEIHIHKSREPSPRSVTPKSALRTTDYDAEGNDSGYSLRSTSPKMIRFEDEPVRTKPRTQLYAADKMVGNAIGVVQTIEENSKTLHRILQKTLADSKSGTTNPYNVEGAAAALTVSEGLDELGNRLMRETSPLRRKGTHTGVPLRTDDNINERLTSIKNTIKSIDSLCEEKPYRKEKCQRYIDSLFSESVHFSTKSYKKSSTEELHKSSTNISPSIRVSDLSQRSSEHQLLSRSTNLNSSAESLRSTSPLRAASPLHHHSSRDLRADLASRRH